MLKNYLSLFIGILCMATPAFAAGPWQRFFQNIKLPSQAVMEHAFYSAPLLGTATRLGSAVALNNGSATTISTFTAQPDVARNILLTVGGTSASVAAGTAVVNGLNVFGKAISENFAITSNQAGATTGGKAFVSVTSVVFPATSGAGATVSIGTGAKLGLPHCLKQAGDYDWSAFGGVYDATRGTVVANASAVESNTYTSNTALDGSSSVDVYFVQNYACY